MRALPTPTPFLARDPAGSVRRASIVMPVRNDCAATWSRVRRILAAPRAAVPLEIVVVDDASHDDTWTMLRRLAADDERVVPVRHERRRGPGVAVRTGIDTAGGDVIVVSTGEHHPADCARLLAPIVAGEADAVHGSSSLVAVRADVLRNLRLSSTSTCIHTEIAVRLAQWRARTAHVRVADAPLAPRALRPPGPLARWLTVARTRLVDPQFTHHAGLATLAAVARADGYNRWTLDKVAPWLGTRLLEAGAGIGNLSRLLLRRERLVLADYEPVYVERLRREFAAYGHVRVEQIDLTRDDDCARCRNERIDTVLCSNVIEHIEDDDAVLRRFHEVLAPGGHCIIVVPAGMAMYTALDDALGHYRRYSVDGLRRQMESIGFEVVHGEQFNRFGSLGWLVSGRLLRRRALRPRQMILFDRLLPLARLLERLLPVPGLSLIVVGRKRDEPTGDDGVPLRLAA